jgi:hypothetical protein
MRLNGLRMLGGWACRQLRLEEFENATAAYLRALRPLHPLFSRTMHLIGSSPKEFEPLNDDLSNLATFIQRFGWSRGAPAFWNTEVQPDGTMSLRGTARTGFSFDANTSGARAFPETLSIHLSGGAARLPSALVIEFPESGAPEFLELGFVKQLMQVTIECFHPESIEVVDSGFRDALEAKTHVRPETIGWLNYFDSQEAESVVPEDVHREHFGPHGLLTVIQTQPPRQSDEVALERALRMFNALHPGQHLTHRSDRKTQVIASRV